MNPFGRSILFFDREHRDSFIVVAVVGVGQTSFLWPYLALYVFFR